MIMNYNFCIALQPKLEFGASSVEVSKPHKVKNTHPVGPLGKSNKLVAEAANTTQHTQKEENPCPWRDSKSTSQESSGRRRKPETEGAPGLEIIN